MPLLITNFWDKELGLDVVGPLLMGVVSVCMTSERIWFLIHITI